MVKAWYMEQPLVSARLPDHLSRQDLLKLRRFYTQQLALSVALLEARLPGICKTITSERNGTLEFNLTEAVERECTQLRNDSKETSF